MRFVIYNFFDYYPLDNLPVGIYNIIILTGRYNNKEDLSIMENNVLSKKFSSGGLIKYVVPTIIMMVFMSLYGIVDGIFVANFVNEHALSATNIIMPVFGLIAAIGMMFATGSNALIAKLMGEGKSRQANEFFSLTYLVGLVFGLLSTVFILAFADTFLTLLGTSDILYPYAKSYLLNITPFITMAFMQVFTQCFFVTAGKPMLGFASCFLGGIANIVFDYLFIVTLDMGISGAAIATGIGFTIPGLFGIIYFAISRNCDLHFVKPRWNLKRLGQSLYNGMSEFVTTISSAITTLLFNIILMQWAGEGGVAAITVIMYIQTIQTAVYMGYTLGVSPIISYKYGEQSHSQLKLITKISFKFITVASVVTIAASLIFAEAAVGIFIASDSPTFALAVGGLRIYSLAYIFMGFNIFASGMFTALSNGKISAILSVTRSLVFIVIALLTLPLIFGINGIWVAIPIAETLAIFMSIRYYKKNKPIYNY